MADGPLIWIKAFSNSYLLPVFSAIHGSSWLLSRKTFYFHVQAASPTSSQDTKSASRFCDPIRSAACRHPSEKLSNSFWLRVMVKSFKWIGSLSVLVLSSLPPKFDLIFSIFRYVLWQPLLWTCFTSFCISSPNRSKMFSKSSNSISLHLHRIRNSTMVLGLAFDHHGCNCFFRLRLWDPGQERQISDRLVRRKAASNSR